MTQTAFDREQTFPQLPLADWKSTKNTLHLYLQIIGKIRLEMHPPINHWWHVTLYVSTWRERNEPGGILKIFY